MHFTFPKSLMVVALLVASSADALADDIHARCIDESNGTNPAWAQCGGALVAREDAKLNAAWKALYEKAKDETKKDLLAEQRLWNAYKESSCKFYDNGEMGREGQVLHFPICRAGVIAARRRELQKYYDSIFLGHR